MHARTEQSVLTHLEQNGIALLPRFLNREQLESMRSAMESGLLPLSSTYSERRISGRPLG
jgi:hypothetical protein